MHLNAMACTGSSALQALERTAMHLNALGCTGSGALESLECIAVHLTALECTGSGALKCIQMHCNAFACIAVHRIWRTGMHFRALDLGHWTVFACAAMYWNAVDLAHCNVFEFTAVLECIAVQWIWGTGMHLNALHCIWLHWTALGARTGLRWNALECMQCS